MALLLSVILCVSQSIFCDTFCVLCLELRAVDCPLECQTAWSVMNCRVALLGVRPFLGAVCSAAAKLPWEIRGTSLPSDRGWGCPPPGVA